MASNPQQLSGHQEEAQGPVVADRDKNQAPCSPAPVSVASAVTTGANASVASPELISAELRSTLVCEARSSFDQFDQVGVREGLIRPQPIVSPCNINSNVRSRTILSALCTDSDTITDPPPISGAPPSLHTPPKRPPRFAATFRNDIDTDSSSDCENIINVQASDEYFDYDFRHSERHTRRSRQDMGAATDMQVDQHMRSIGMRDRGARRHHHPSSRMATGHQVHDSTSSFTSSADNVMEVGSQEYRMVKPLRRHQQQQHQQFRLYRNVGRHNSNTLADEENTNVEGNVNGGIIEEQGDDESEFAGSQQMGRRRRHSKDVTYPDNHRRSFDDDEDSRSLTDFVENGSCSVFSSSEGRGMSPHDYPDCNNTNNGEGRGYFDHYNDFEPYDVGPHHQGGGGGEGQSMVAWVAIGNLATVVVLSLLYLNYMLFESYVGVLMYSFLISEALWDTKVKLVENLRWLVDDPSVSPRSFLLSIWQRPIRQVFTDEFNGGVDLFTTTAACFGTIAAIYSMYYVPITFLFGGCVLGAGIVVTFMFDRNVLMLLRLHRAVLDDHTLVAIIIMCVLIISGLVLTSLFVLFSVRDAMTAIDVTSAAITRWVQDDAAQELWIQVSASGQDALKSWLSNLEGNDTNWASVVEWVATQSAVSASTQTINNHHQSHTSEARGSELDRLMAADAAACQTSLASQSGIDVLLALEASERHECLAHNDDVDCRDASSVSKGVKGTGMQKPMSLSAAWDIWDGSMESLVNLTRWTVESHLPGWSENQTLLDMGKVLYQDPGRFLNQQVVDMDIPARLHDLYVGLLSGSAVILWLFLTLVDFSVRVGFWFTVTLFLLSSKENVLHAILKGFHGPPSAAPLPPLQATPMNDSSTPPLATVGEAVADDQRTDVSPVPPPFVSTNLGMNGNNAVGHEEEVSPVANFEINLRKSIEGVFLLPFKMAFLHAAATFSLFWLFSGDFRFFAASVSVFFTLFPILYPQWVSLPWCIIYLYNGHVFVAFGLQVAHYLGLCYIDEWLLSNFQMKRKGVRPLFSSANNNNNVGSSGDSGEEEKESISTISPELGSIKLDYSTGNIRRSVSSPVDLRALDAEVPGDNTNNSNSVPLPQQTPAAGAIGASLLDYALRPPPAAPFTTGKRCATQGQPQRVLMLRTSSLPTNTAPASVGRGVATNRSVPIQLPQRTQSMEYGAGVCAADANSSPETVNLNPAFGILDEEQAAAAADNSKTNYVTGLSLFFGVNAFGAQGVVLGPLLVCVGIVVYETFVGQMQYQQQQQQRRQDALHNYSLQQQQHRLRRLHKRKTWAMRTIGSPQSDSPSTTPSIPYQQPLGVRTHSAGPYFSSAASTASTNGALLSPIVPLYPATTPRTSGRGGVVEENGFEVGGAKRTGHAMTAPRLMRGQGNRPRAASDTEREVGQVVGGRLRSGSARVGGSGGRHIKQMISSSVIKSGDGNLERRHSAGPWLHQQPQQQQPPRRRTVGCTPFGLTTIDPQITGGYIGQRVPVGLNTRDETDDSFNVHQAGATSPKSPGLPPVPTMVGTGQQHLRPHRLEQRRTSSSGSSNSIKAQRMDAAANNVDDDDEVLELNRALEAVQQRARFPSRRRRHQERGKGRAESPDVRSRLHRRISSPGPGTRRHQRADPRRYEYRYERIHGRGHSKCRGSQSGGEARHREEGGGGGYIRFPAPSSKSFSAPSSPARRGNPLGDGALFDDQDSPDATVLERTGAVLLRSINHISSFFSVTNAMPTSGQITSPSGGGGNGSGGTNGLERSKRDGVTHRSGGSGRAGVRDKVHKNRKRRG